MAGCQVKHCYLHCVPPVTRDNLIPITLETTSLVDSTNILGLCTRRDAYTCMIRKTTLKSGSRQTAIILLLLMIGGDVQMNPGPKASTIYPCGPCELKVSWAHRAVCCDECSLWYHKSCIEMCTPDYEQLQNSNVSWLCCKCYTANYHVGLFRSYTVDTVGENMFSVLAEDNSEDSIATANSSFNPHMFSSPKKLRFHLRHHQY